MNKQEAIERKEYLEGNKKFVSECFDKQIAELNAIIDAPESGWFVPVTGDNFWYLGSDGIFRGNHKGFEFSERILERQKVSRTEAEAQREDDKRKATVKYLKEIARLNKGWKPDWSDGNQKKHCTDLINNQIVSNYFWVTKTKDSDWYSISEQAAKEAVLILSQNEQDLIFRS